MNKSKLIEGTRSLRSSIKQLTAETRELAEQCKTVTNDPPALSYHAGAPTETPAPPMDKGEMIANAMLAMRHLEDAAMRLGKCIQAADGGVSVYDK